MGYKKREINLEVEEDLEFRRIERDFESGVEKVVEKLIISGISPRIAPSASEQNKVLFTMNGGETSIYIEPYVSNSVELYLNGQLMVKDDFYEETNPDIGLISFKEEVVNGDKIFVKYTRKR